MKREKTRPEREKKHGKRSVNLVGEGEGNLEDWKSDLGRMGKIELGEVLRSCGLNARLVQNT